VFQRTDRNISERWASWKTDLALRELVTRLADVCGRMRARMNRLGDLDLASQDVLVGAVRDLEQQLWVLRVSGTGSASA
jgi:hypothetical protein